MLRILTALSACDEASLLARAHRGRQDQVAVHGSLPDLMSLAMALALLRPMRLLNLTGGGPACVGELPFGQVYEAAECCRDLYAHDQPSPTTRPLPDWVARQALEVWIVDAAAWKRRLGEAEAASAVLSANEALVRCAGRTVAASRHRRLPMGPLEGAEGVELIMQDGTVAFVATATEVRPVALLGARLAPAPASPHPVWCFEDALGTWRRVAPVATAGVIVQPSPVFVEATQPVYL
jgi:hypothetical protein